MVNISDVIKSELQKVVVGQDKMIEALVVGLLCKGHILLEGVPGVAKTTTVNSLSQALGLKFSRVQFTPDLLPSDIVGTQLYDPSTNQFKVKKGPVFTNLLLADEINRAPAKVQSALLEVMQEKQVTIGDETHRLDLPFLVLATQNPIENEGAYALPEAQLDRFMMKVIVGYNTKEQELEVAKRVANSDFGVIKRVVDRDMLDLAQKEMNDLHIDKEVEEYIVDIVMATRDPSKYGINELDDLIEFGASPRASIDLYKASRAIAYIHKQTYVSPMNVAYVANEVLRHRIIMSYEAEAKGITTDDIVNKIVSSLPVP